MIDFLCMDIAWLQHLGGVWNVVYCILKYGLVLYYKKFRLILSLNPPTFSKLIVIRLALNIARALSEAKIIRRYVGIHINKSESTEKMVRQGRVGSGKVCTAALVSKRR